MSAVAEPVLAIPDPPSRQILGLQFFTGNAAQAIERMSAGGLLVVPAAPALKDLPTNASYREALLNADLTLTDSSFMVILWNLLERDNIPKISGLAYLRELLLFNSVREKGNSFWIMASGESSERNLAWLKTQGIELSPDDVYVAPMYLEEIRDLELVRRLQERRPRHIIVTIGGGTQERLGLYLKRSLDYLPAIHCLGAAIAFLSGDQVRIPIWADSLGLGWFLRCLWEPRRYISRYWSARKLFPLLLRYRDQLPTITD
jgi:N-acetylglucosaminyldiphosphoundecaprenol N-acetyl-beta-D-mannosaminyltransferase